MKYFLLTWLFSGLVLAFIEDREEMAKVPPFDSYMRGVKFTHTEKIFSRGPVTEKDKLKIIRVTTFVLNILCGSLWIILEKIVSVATGRKQ